MKRHRRPSPRRRSLSRGLPLTLLSLCAALALVAFAWHHHRRGAAAPPRIAILVVADQKTAAARREHIASLRCYTARHGYGFFVVDLDSGGPGCEYASRPFFLKQCRVQRIVAASAGEEARVRRFDWFLALDSDVFVVNAATKLEKYLPADPRFHLVLYERFHNAEIAAAGYLVRSSPQGVGILRRWVALENPPLLSEPTGSAASLVARGETSLSFGAVPNADNGALHLAVLNETAADRGDARNRGFATCLRVGQTMYMVNGVEHNWMARNGRMVACTRCVLGGRRFFPKAGIAILRRGHGFSRDFFVSSPGWETPDEGPVDNLGMVIGPSEEAGAGIELFFHGYKKPLRDFYSEPIKARACLHERSWAPKMREDRTAGLKRVLKRVKMRADYAISNRKISVGIDDIGDCWPDCSPELTSEQERRLREELCPAGLAKALGFNTMGNAAQYLAS